MLRNTHIWLIEYSLKGISKCFKDKPQEPIHIIFCICDHFEPLWNNADYKKGLNRVKTWVKRYPEVANKHCDSDGYSPKYSFFYPAEEYRPEYLDLLAELCHNGYGEVEIHLHHDNDTPENLRETLLRFKETLANRHNLLSQHEGTKEIKYGFIHGNWALDNSRRDGRWCGVNNELQILRETGCYADFTLPSAPSETQTRKINSIYYAKDDPERPKSHNKGIDVEVGKEPYGDLMIIQGPLGLNWRNRKWGILPRIENGEITFENPPTPERIDQWVSQRIHVKGRENWIFVKIHTHGAQEKNMESLLGGYLDRLYSYLEERYNDGKDYFLHYVSPREMYNIIKAAEAGSSGNPGTFRNYLLVNSTT